MIEKAVYVGVDVARSTLDVAVSDRILSKTRRQQSDGLFNGKLRDELLNREVFTTLTKAKVLIEQWKRGYNQERSHSSLGYRPPAPEAIMPVTLT